MFGLWIHHEHLYLCRFTGPCTVTMMLTQILWQSLASTLRDILPLLIVIAFFQLVVLRRPLVNVPRLAWGVALVLFGLSIFLVGLELALFPLGEEMAAQLSDLQETKVAADLDPVKQEVEAHPLEQQTVTPRVWDFYWT